MRVVSTGVTARQLRQCIVDGVIVSRIIYEYLAGGYESGGLVKRASRDTNGWPIVGIPKKGWRRIALWSRIRTSLRYDHHATPGRRVPQLYRPNNIRAYVGTGRSGNSRLDARALAPRILRHRTDSAPSNDAACRLTCSC